ncbi:type II toxin-antitoxin system VapC family toxin [Haloarchaeobius litoreus]|uniref:Type II toxin-antitoxin system VapC family toxin n=1 Tax=Haloarchaeobius litoreus TaxID=755306 RepID=A0ABD6DKL3_9EURY|nr:type II toxin-antitoxin system VapC family toxin [Haloarchaeobius litoreus]
MTRDRSLEEVFVDTCVLLNFVQQEWERPHSKALVESNKIELVVSDAVMGELTNVSERRADIYEDLIDFLLTTEDAAIQEYDPEDRHIYVGGNDAGHIRDIQMELASLDDTAEVLRRLRRYLRAVDRRFEFLESKLNGHVVVPSGSLTLEFAVQRVVPNQDDARIVTDAAGWTADGGSGYLVTLDSEHLLGLNAEVAAVLREKAGDDWVITICSPETILERTPSEAN